jgi:TetR/AcrR family transcriptional repressor of nem operon
VSTTEFVNAYVSREHRDAPGEGCAIAALGADAARQSSEVRKTFASGTEKFLEALQGEDNPGGHERISRAQAIGLLAHSVGAVVLSRACPDDSPLADEILDACREEILAALASTSVEPAAASPSENG